VEYVNMENLIWLIGFAWGAIGAFAAISSNRGYLWRIAIFIGPLFYLIFPGDPYD
jgi:hypothetical protein